MGKRGRATAEVREAKYHEILTPIDGWYPWEHLFEKANWKTDGTYGNSCKLWSLKRVRYERKITAH